MHISELETPAVIVDLDVMERNLSRMAAYCRSKKLRLRPHTKTHKIPELAKRQLASGANGITVAKIGEAEVMANAGITDILIAYPLIGLGKAERLAALAARADITVALDSSEVAQALSNELHAKGVHVGVLVELDVGFGRCGFANPESVLTVARKIAGLPALEFQGLMFFPGHFQVVAPERAQLLGTVNEFLRESLRLLEENNLAATTVSGGSTPTAFEGHLFHRVNEI